MAGILAAALSGGGAKGGAHVGVLTALHQQGIAISAVGGTSAGAVVAGLMACGYDPPQLMDILMDFGAKGRRFLDVNVSGALRGAITGAPVGGLLRGDRLHRYLTRLCGTRTLRQAVLPLVITAVDIRSGQLIFFTSHADQTCKRMRASRDVVLDDIKIADAIRASIAIPGVFCPFSMQDRLLVDGGVLDPMPANALYGIGARRVLGVNLGYYGQTRCEVDNAVEIVSQSISLMGYQLLRTRSFLADAVLHVDAGIGTLAFDRVEQAARAGYRAAMTQMDAILSAAQEPADNVQNSAHLRAV